MAPILALLALVVSTAQARSLGPEVKALATETGPEMGVTFVYDGGDGTRFETRWTLLATMDHEARQIRLPAAPLAWNAYDLVERRYLFEWDQAYPFYASSWPILNLATPRDELERTALLIGNQRRIAIVVAPSATRRPVFHFKLADYCESSPAKFRNLTYAALGCDRVTDDDVMYAYTRFCRQERQDLYEDVILGVISCPGARAIYLGKGCPSDGEAGWACPR